MNILQVCIYYPPSVGGVETFVYNLNSTLLASFKDCSITTLCFKRGSNEPDDSVVNGVRVLRLKPLITLSSQSICLFLKKKIKAILLETKPDIIHFHYPNPLLSNALVSAYLETGCGARFFVHWHGDIVGRRLLKRWYVKSTRRLLEASEQLSSDTLLYARSSCLLKNYQKPVAVIPALPDYRVLNPTFENQKIVEFIKTTAAGRKIVFSFGRFVKWKGFSLLLEAFLRLPKNEYVLFLGGDGKYKKQLKKMAKDLDNVFFVGRIGDDSKYSWLTHCDVFVFPSIGRQEAFGICLAEAMFCKALCITFDCPTLGARTIAVPDFSCISASPVDSESLAKAIMRSLSLSEEERSRLVENAFALLMQNCSPDIYFNSVVSFYSKRPSTDVWDNQ